MGIVECVDVKKTYNQGKLRVEALRGVTLSVDRGAFVAIAGPSGSGKTTLLNIIGGLDAADSGTVIVDKHPLDKMNQSQLASLRLHKVGFVFPSSLPWRTLNLSCFFRVCHTTSDANAP
jgi:putative ABC transport system ATP-binding protein